MDTRRFNGSRRRFLQGSVMAAGSDPQAEIAKLAAQGGSLRGQFVDLMLARLAPVDLDLSEPPAPQDSRVAELSPLRATLRQGY